MALTEIKTSGIADDAVTTDKLANAINTERTANTAKVQTTINTNADNRVLTGTGTANTIQGESQLLFDSNGLLYIKAPDGGNRYFFGETGDSQSAQLSLYNSSDTQKVRIAAGDGASEAATYFNGGKVGIGTTSPASPLHLHESTSGSIEGLKVTNSGTGSAVGDGLSIGLQADEDVFIHNYENTAIHFGTNDTTRLSILAGGGLTFNGDTGAGNALSDYEKGSWSPTIYSSNASSNWTYTSSGRYVKVGHLVSLWGQISWTGVGGSGVVNLGGLPYSTHNTAANNAAVTIGSRSGWNYHRLCGQMHQSGYINVQFVDASGSYGSFNVSPGAVASSGHIYINWSYESGY